MNILIIAAHPDDEVLGCAGTILKRKKEGHTISVCIATRPPLNFPEDKFLEKRKEVEAVAKHLGVSKVYYLEYPTVTLNTIPHNELNRKLFDVITAAKADIVYTHHRGDNNMDHRILFDATLVATRPEPGQRVKEVYSYESLSSTEWGAIVPERAFIPTVFEDITPFIDQKVKAMEIYASEIKAFPHPRSSEGIRLRAQYRGLTVGMTFAEAFVLIRKIG